MAKLLTFPRVSLTDARTGKRVRVSAFQRGDAIVPEPEPILGYTYQAGHLTVYVSGTMPLALRSAAQEGCTDQETWLVDELPQGIQEIDWTDCRREFRLLQKAAYAPMDPLPLPRNPAPKAGPRNLTVSLAAWLRQLGFAVLEQGGLMPTGLEASWRAPDGLLYQASYHYAPERATFQLLSSPGHQATAATYKGLVVRAEVNRLREVRFLLLSNIFYKEARQAALDAGLLRPTYAPHTD